MESVSPAGKKHLTRQRHATIFLVADGKLREDMGIRNARGPRAPGQCRPESAAGKEDGEMQGIVSKRTVACALAAALALAAAAPAAAAERSRPSGRQSAGERTISAAVGGVTGVAGAVWRTIRALWGEEGGMIDPDGAPVPVLRPARLAFDSVTTDFGLTDGEVGSPGA